MLRQIRAMATSGDGRLLYVAEMSSLLQEMDELQARSPHSATAPRAAAAPHHNAPSRTR